jgi:uncharacterized membrane protein
VPPLVWGLLFVVFGLPLVAGKVPPNRFYGFRTPATIADATLWYRVNRAAGLDLVAGGLVLVAAHFMLPRDSLLETVLLVLVVALMVAHGVYLVRAHRPPSAPARCDPT